MFDFYRKNRNLKGSNLRRMNRQRSFRQTLIWEGALEDRRLLTISWANRATTDNFGVFGANANTARGVVDQAIAYWNSYLNISTPYALDVTISADIGNGASTSVGSYQFTAGRWRPDGATISVDSGNDGAGGGYFFDPTPADNSEFPTVFSPYVMNTGPGSPANGLDDFLTLITHEIGHAVGYISRFLAPDGQTVIGGGIGYDNPFTANTGQVYSDPTAAPPSATYWVYDSPSVETVLTNFNSGGGGEAFAGPVHAAENNGAGRAIAWAGSTYFTSLDLMTPYYTANQRKLISYNTLNVINESVGWGLGASPLANAIITLDPSGNLFVSGDSTDNLIRVSTSPLGMVDVVVTTQILGVHPNNMITASFPAGLVRSVTVDAERGNDTVDLANYVAVASPAPVIIGGWGNDLIYGTRLADNITGNEDDDTVYGGDGNDTIEGGSGNDRLYAGLGTNTMFDGPGDDLLDFSLNAARIIFTTSSGNDSVIGTAFDDIITGSAGTDRLEGLAGNDILTGGLGNDALFGGDDSDRFIWSAGDGFDMIEGGGGSNDLVFNGDAAPGATNVFRVGRSGTRADVGIDGFASVSTANVQYLRLYGGLGADTFYVSDLTGTQVSVVELNYSSGVGSNALIDATPRNDAVTVAPVILGVEIGAQVTGLYALVIIAGAKIVDPANLDRVTVRGLEGNDTLKSAVGVEGVLGVVMEGGEGNDLLSADATLLGGPGNDTFVVPLGINVIDGGSGNDVILVEGSDANDRIEVAQTVVVPGTVSRVDIHTDSGSSTNTVENVDQIKIAGLGGDDNLLMGGSGNLIPFAAYGGFGNDTISGRGFFGTEMARAGITAYGEAGSDRIQGGANLDRLFGGEDSDIFIWMPVDGLDFIDGGTGSDAFVVVGSIGTDCFEVRPDFALATQVRVNVDISGGPTMDGSILAADVEHVSLQGGDGDDLFTIDPLHTTPLELLDINFGPEPGISDAVVLNLSNAGSSIDIASGDTDASVDINGLSEVIRIYGATTLDTLLVNGGESMDYVQVTPGALATISVVVNGGSGDDYITGATTVIGGPGKDHIIGSPFDDVILGGLDDDYINGLAGADLILGDADGTGAGSVTITCENGMFSIEPFAILPYAAAGGNDIILGGDGNDTLNGGFADDRIEGGAGDDLIGYIAMAVNPLLPSNFDEPGNDNVRAGTGDDTVDGAAGDDWLYGEDGDDVISGFTGDDLIEGGTGADYITGGEGDDSVRAGSGNDTVWGDAGNDRIDGEDGDDSVRAGFGDDFVYGGAGIDSLSGEDGDDMIYAGDDRDYVYGGDGNDTLNGEAGDDWIYAEAGDDLVFGGDGADNIYGDQGADSIHGEAGDDTLLGEQDNDYITGGDGNDYVAGNQGDDLLFGDAGNDGILGGEGNDTAWGGTGNDAINGMEGDDRLYGEDGNDTVRGEAGRDFVTGDNGNDLLYGNDDNDSIHGGAGSDTAYGGLGADLITGWSENDLLCGGPASTEPGDPTLDGNDTMLGGTGNDAVFGDYGNDLVNGGEGNDNLWGNQGNDILGIIEYAGVLYQDFGADSMVGGEGDDFISGSLDPQDGNDAMFGQAGDDTLWGGAGGDMIYGGEGDDDMLGGTPVTANIAHVPRDPSLPGDGNDTMLGGNGFDQVDGGNDNNLMDAGDDGIRETVLGGLGNDMAYSHQKTDPVNYDILALDGGFNHKFQDGFLLEPPVPNVDCEFVTWVIPSQFYTGYKVLHDGTVVQQPPMKYRTSPNNGPNGPVKKPVPIKVKTPPKKAAAPKGTAKPAPAKSAAPFAGKAATVGSLLKGKKTAGK